MSLIIPANTLSADDGIANSCRFFSDTVMKRTNATTSTNRQQGCFSTWIKKCNVSGTGGGIITGYVNSTNFTVIYFDSDHRLCFLEYQSGSSAGFLRTPNIFKDPSAWMHIAYLIDTTQGTAADRVKVYINGTQITSFHSGGTTQPSQDNTLNLFTASTSLDLGQDTSGSPHFMNGYLAETLLVDGATVAIGDLGEFDEDSSTIWKPKDISEISVGTNGFYLNYEDSSNLGNAVDGGTDLTETNLAAADQATDTPTNNFCTLNPLEAVTATTTYAEGNMQGTTSNAARATFAVSNGKWYWEHKFVNKEAMGGVMAYNGFAPNAYTINALIQGSNPELVLNGTEQSSWSGDGTPDALVDNDILNVALDCDNNRIAFGVNGAWLNATDGSGEWSGTTLNYFSISDGYDYAPAFRTGSGTNRVSHMNFGGCPGFAISSGNADANGYGNFEYSVPSGFFSLCSKNLAQYG